MGTRVIFIPGILGSVLADRHLDGRDEAARLCVSNLDEVVNFALSTAGESFMANANPCVDPNNPAVLWGEWGCAHWLFDTPEWIDRLNSGNGIDVASGSAHGVIVSRAHNDGLAKTVIDFHGLGGAALRLFKLRDTVIDPYGPIVSMLRDMQGRGHVDLLVFPYDWRLSNAYNATLLAEAIRLKWWRRSSKEDFARLTPARDEQVTIIAHSMGGLLARYFIESADAKLNYITRQTVRATRLDGHRLVKRLVTIGTPHLGAPKSYLSFIGVVNPLEFQSSFLTFLRSQLFLPRVFDWAVSTELSLLTRGTSEFLPPLPQVGDEVPRNADIPVSPGQVRQLTRHMSSLVEMFPAWDINPRPPSADPSVAARNFNLDTDARRLYAEAHEPGRPLTELPRLLNHLGTHRRPWEMFQQFRGRLVPGPCLNQWLKSAGVNYHAIAATSHPTIIRAPAPNEKPSESPETGDGVVPTISGLLTPWTSALDSNVDRVPLRSDYAHDMLCRDANVLDRCRELVAPDTPRRRARRGIREVVPIWRFEALGGLVDHLIVSGGFRNLPSRTIVTVARIRFSSPPQAGPFADWFTHDSAPTIPSSEYRHSKPAWPSKQWTVTYESGTQSIGQREVVAIDAQETLLDRPLAAGGVVFLPESPCQQDLEVLAWNLGGRSTLSTGVVNTTHAEVQLVRWIIDRFSGWLERQSRRLGMPLLEAIDLTNKLRGDSPCAMCQDDLRKLGRWATAQVSHRPIGTLAWSRLYGSDVYNATSGPTYRKDLEETVSAGWTVAPPSPWPTK